jgi:arylsulfatase A
MTKPAPISCLLAAALLAFSHPAQAAEKPNVVLIFADDLGINELSCYGRQDQPTPNLDRMAAEGMRFTQFYSAAEVCTPSRAALLTGRLPPRSGMCSNKRRVAFPNTTGGLPADEVTIAELLKADGYATACIGKWHLGHLPQYSPLENGFDYYFGLPYSNDMDRVPMAPKGRAAFLDPKSEYWNVPLLKNREIVEQPANQHTLTRRYTDEAIGFIRQHKEQPFFVYLPHTMPHVPLFVSDDVPGSTRRGLFGDVIWELDQEIGRILKTLRDEGLAEKTLVLFTSDNGPWLTQGEQGGSAGLLKDGKGSTWEGGMRVPCLAWMPGTVPSGIVNAELASTLDFLPTICSLTGVEPPRERRLDGYDVLATLKGKPSPRREMFFYRGFELMAVRLGAWKAHFQTQSGYGQPLAERHDSPLLFNLEVDPSERFNVAAANPEVLREIDALVEKHRSGMQAAPSQLE